MLRLRSMGLLLALLAGCADDGAPPLRGSAGGSTGTESGGSGSTTGPLTSSGTSGSGTSGSGTTASETSDTETGFEIVAETALTEDGRLGLRCNLPRGVEECMAIPQAPCADADQDGLVDAWEDVALDLLRPARRFDEAEPYFDDATGVLGDVGRVAPVDDHVRIYVMLGYSRDYGSCAGLTSHNGDSERVVIDLLTWQAAGPGGVVFDAVYTAAHEGAPTDASRLFPREDLSELVVQLDPASARPRWFVYPSSGKHATYASVEICEGISNAPCIEEDCGADGVEDPSAFEVLPAFVNAGEPEAPRVDALDELGFVGETAWGDSPFCGGLGGNGCPPSVRDKLINDPFAE